MLRQVFVFVIIGIGIVYAVQGPFYALLFYLWNAYFRPESWVWGGGSTIRALDLSLVIGIYLVATSVLSARIFRLNLRTGLLLAFFAQSFLSTIASEHPDDSWTWWPDFVKVLLITYLIVTLVTDRRRYRLTLLVIAYSLGLECAKQGWAQLILNPGAQNNNLNVFLGDNNGVALGTMMLVPVFGALAQTASRRWEAYLHRFFLVGVFYRGITTYSRGGFLAAIALGIIGFIRSRHKIRALVSIGVIALVVTMVMPQKFWDRMHTITAPAETRDESAQGRLHFWEVALVMAEAKPLTGVGFNAYEASYQTYNPFGEFEGVRSPHSVWFGLIAEMGYPGLVFFLAIFLLAISSCLWISVSTKWDTSGDLRTYATAMVTSFVAFAVAGTFLPFQYNEMTWHFLGLASALRLITAAERSASVPQMASESIPTPRAVYPAVLPPNVAQAPVGTK
jgi:probable O-glycosylation ligase (exosortase A-associated)